MNTSWWPPQKPAYGGVLWSCPDPELCTATAMLLIKTTCCMSAPSVIWKSQCLQRVAMIPLCSTEMYSRYLSSSVRCLLLGVSREPRTQIRWGIRGLDHSWNHRVKQKWITKSLNQIYFEKLLRKYCVVLYLHHNIDQTETCQSWESCQKTLSAQVLTGQLCYHSTQVPCPPI